MCETTRAIERHPESQRKLLKIREVCERWERRFERALKELAQREDPDAVSQ